VAVVLSESFNNLTDAPWLNPSSLTIVAGGRTGTCAQVQFGGGGNYFIPSANESDYVTWGFAWKVSAVGSIAIPIVSMRSDSNGTQHLTFMLTTAGAIEVRRGSTTGTVIGTTAATGLVTANTWAFIEFRARLHDTLGFVIIRVNGTEQLNLPATQDTKNGGGKTTIDTLTLNNVNTITSLFDDMYAATGSGETFKGEPPWPPGSGNLTRADLRLLSSGVPIARMAQMTIGVLTRLGFTEARVTQHELRAVIRTCNKVWLYVGTGTQPFTSDYRIPVPLMVWNGTEMRHAMQISTWDGTEFTHPICPEPPPPFDGCFELLTEPFNNLTAWTEMIGTPTIVTGRTGSGVELEGSSGDAIFYSIPTISQTNTLTMGFAWKATQNLERVICQFQSEGVVHLELASNESGVINVRRGSPTGTILASTPSGTYTTNTWYYIEWQAKLNNMTGFVKLRINGTLLVSLTNIDTRNGPSKLQFDRVAIGTSHTQVITLDDLYLSSGAGCAFWGEQNYILTEPFNNMTAWRLGNASIVAGGRNGNGLLLPNGGGSLVFDIPAASRSETVTVGFAFRTSIIGIQAPLIEFRSDSSGVRHGMLTIEADNSFKWWRSVAPGGTTLLTSAAGLVVVDTWYYVEMQYKLNDTNGSVIVRLNETNIMSGTGLDTKNGGTETTISMIYLTNITGPSPNTIIDDLYVSTGPDPRFRGDLHLT
jgi:hypothetical protein